ncbi:T9SS type A sorting domain-containing protein [Wenyingzhuangia aestuarii]|uniref:T9SS type A sorting domain-containing protein n=1 Tax=Wenyingzhuangia aestuarii TaxID=1647582 RepID=UPI00143AE30F|nr:T9SS type A sorting domain-containing protein [Wenyingzhuangia aestuarii]NJB83953.1 hypothetical protein [Wenyingzhuangia aestuarii]
MKKLLLMVGIMASQLITAQSVTIDTAPSSAEIGETITIAITFDTGNTDEATEIYYELRDVTEGVSLWKYSQLLSITAASSGTHSTTNFTIPTTSGGVDLDDTKDYQIVVNYKIGSAWGPGNTQSIDITPAPVTESWSWGDNLVFTPGTTLDVPIKYTSEEDIAAGGIKFVIWTETRGTVNDVNLFSDIWYGAFSNPSILPAGTNVETTITITAPNGMINPSTSKTYLSSDLTTWDPNAGDAGRNYVDHETTPAPIYTYQFRTALGTDASFQVKPGSTDFTISESLSTNQAELSKIAVSPNPTTGILNIADLDGVTSISILTLTGQVVKEFDVKSTINISDLTPGVYILLTNNGKYKKIIKN